LDAFFSAIFDVIKSSGTYEIAVRFAVLLAFCAVGELIAERAGTLNISTEGMILGGAFTAAMVYDHTERVSLGLLAAAGAGLIVAMVHANLSHRMTLNTFVVGLTMNALVFGVVTFLQHRYDPVSNTAHVFKIPGLSSIPLIGRAFFGQRWPLYLIYPLIPLAWFVLYRTRWGLEVRSVGENPQAAHVSGIDVNKRRREGVYISGLTSGLGGGYLLLGQIGLFDNSLVGGRGFIAIAAVIFGGWRLRGAIAGCLLFGTVDSFRTSIQVAGHKVNAELLQSLPYVVTILTVAFFAHRHRPPAALARPFERGLT
jgi:simple sugar transport system permease protein